MKKIQTEILEIKCSISKIKDPVGSLTKRHSQAKERIWGFEDKVDELFHSDSNKEKNEIVNRIHEAFGTWLKDQAYKFLA